MVKGFFLDKSQRSLDHLFTQSLYTSTGNQLSTQCYSCLVFIIKMCTVPPLLVCHCAPYTVHLYFLQHQNRFSINSPLIDYFRNIVVSSSQFLSIQAREWETDRTQDRQTAASLPEIGHTEYGRSEEKKWKLNKWIIDLINKWIVNQINNKIKK